MHPRLPLLLAALLLLAAPRAFALGDDAWERTLERVVPSVVSLRVSAPRAFDTEPASVSMATGFVVDAEHGLILTNRHVVQPGPVVSEAVFLDYETVDVQPVYRDPVHDFGFYRYDPSQVRFLRPAALPLAPEAARVGVEVRVVGNDAGEKLSILDGTLARLDRDAPEYGRGRFNDFNTFYLQAASSSSGGSSGSPVVNRAGRVIALNAGGRRGSASSFFLPLDRVVRALAYVREGKPVPRGTLQTVFRHRAYDELRRLGLGPETEARVRKAHPESDGLLVVDQVVPGGPGDGRLQPGDVLLRVEGRRVADFATLEALLDDSVGASVVLSVERGGSPLEIAVPVGDLHAITPDRYLEMGGGIFHPLSYQQARGAGVAVAGIAVAFPGYAFGRAGIPRQVVVTHVDGAPVADLDAFEAALAARPDGAPLRVRYFHLANPGSPVLGVFRVDRRWFPMQQCVRDDASGLWPCRPSPPPPPGRPPEPATVSLDVAGPRAARELAPSLAVVDFDVPFMIDGVQGSAFQGAGLVVDAEAGLVVVDRDTVPVTLGDVQLTFGGGVEIPGRVVVLHPDHNLAVVRYDPALLGDTPVRSARLETDPLRPGESLWLAALTPGQQLVARESQVARVEDARIPLPLAPRFRETNVELAALTETVSGIGGALADGKGRVRALWASFSRDRQGRPGSFFAGLPASLVEELVEPLRRGAPFVWHATGIELEALTLAAARARGLPGPAARRLEDHDALRRRVLAVRRLAAGTPAAAALAVGDLVLAVDGAPVTRFRELELAARAGMLDLTVLREGEEREVRFEAPPLEGEGTDRALVWAGALLQAPPRELALQRGVPPTGVYVAGRWSGTPAQRYELPATVRIVAVDGAPTPDLDAFLRAVQGARDRQSVRLRTVDLEGRVEVRTLELDLQYWPTQELRREPQGWVRRPRPPVPPGDLDESGPAH